MLVSHLSLVGVPGQQVEQDQSLVIRAPKTIEKAEAAEVQQEEQEQEVVEEKPETDEQSRTATQEEILAEVEDTPVLYHVAKCESSWRHYDKEGNVLRGHVDNNDVGVMQINERYHLKNSQELGYDIYTLEGNIGYAKYLYEKKGLQPWSASQACWSDDIHLALK